MSRQVRHSPRALVAAGIAALVVAASVAACAGPGSPATQKPAALVVGKLLELRWAKSADEKAYALFFKSDAIPKSLAEASARETTSTKPPIPEWEAPYASTLASSSADVVVVWKSDPAFPGHSAATVFKLELYQGRWVVVDATDVRGAAKIAPPLSH